MSPLRSKRSRVHVAWLAAMVLVAHSMAACSSTEPADPALSALIIDENDLLAGPTVPGTLEPITPIRDEAAGIEEYVRTSRYHIPECTKPQETLAQRLRDGDPTGVERSGSLNGKPYLFEVSRNGFAAELYARAYEGRCAQQRITVTSDGPAYDVDVTTEPLDPQGITPTPVALYRQNRSFLDAGGGWTFQLLAAGDIDGRLVMVSTSMYGGAYSELDVRYFRETVQKAFDKAAKTQHDA